MASYVLSKASITYIDVSVFKPKEDAQKLHDAMKGTGKHTPLGRQNGCHFSDGIFIFHNEKSFIKIHWSLFLKI